jgi:hypothetical protein
LVQEIMNVIYLAAVTGLATLVSGVLLVGVGLTPRAGQAGTIMAAFGVVMLVVVAVHQIFA